MESGVFSWQMEGVEQATVKKRVHAVYSSAGLGIGEFDERSGSWTAWRVDPTNSITDIVSFLKDIAQPKRCLYFDIPGDILVPEALAPATDWTTWYTFQAQLPEHHQVLHQAVSTFDAVSAFPIPDAWFEAMQQAVPAWEPGHVQAPIAAQLQLVGRNMPTDWVAIDIGPQNVRIWVLNQHKLRFYNGFDMETREDALYFLLAVLEQLELNYAKTPVRLFGTHPQTEAVLQFLREFIPEVTWLLGPETWNGPGLSPAALNRWVSLIASPLCAS